MSAALSRTSSPRRAQLRVFDRDLYEEATENQWTSSRDVRNLTRLRRTWRGQTRRVARRVVGDGACELDPRPAVRGEPDAVAR